MVKIMNLYKFCRPEHKIGDAKFLRMGTLFDFREIENDEIRDEAEGTYKFDIEFRVKVELDRRIANLLLSGAMHFGSEKPPVQIPGTISADVKNIKIVDNTGENVIVEDTSVSVTRTVNNQFIFCMSYMDGGEPISPFSDYNSYWSIPVWRANEFAQKLSELIMSHSPFSEINEDIQNKNSFSSFANISIQWNYGPVNYIDKNIIFDNAADISYDKFLNTMINIPFTKPRKFSSEREYRFAFRISDRSLEYPPKSPIFVPLNTLHYFSK